MSAPRPGRDLHVWAQDLTNWLTRTVGFLIRKPPGATAARDGLMFWDAGGYPVVSRSGAFLRMSMQVDAPASATAAGEAGQWAYDGSFVYVCTATDTWRRAALSSW